MAGLNTHHMKSITGKVLMSILTLCLGIGHLARRYVLLQVTFTHLMCHFRTPYLKMRACMGQCLFQLLLAATRRQYQLQLGIKNIIPYMYHLATSQTQLGMDMGMALFPSPFFLSQRVCVYVIFCVFSFNAEGPIFKRANANKDSPSSRSSVTNFTIAVSS